MLGGLSHVYDKRYKAYGVMDGLVHLSSKRTRGVLSCDGWLSPCLPENKERRVNVLDDVAHLCMEEREMREDVPGALSHFCLKRKRDELMRAGWRIAYMSY